VQQLLVFDVKMVKKKRRYRHIRKYESKAYPIRKESFVTLIWQGCIWTFKRQPF